MVNVENIRNVIASINTEVQSESGIGFNMSLFMNKGGSLNDIDGYQCGTTACIGGHAAICVGDPYARKFKDRMNAYVLLTAQYFGISEAEGDSLCFAYGRPFGTDFSKISRAQAVQVLENLIETGKVDWSIIDGH